MCGTNIFLVDGDGAFCPLMRPSRLRSKKGGERSTFETGCSLASLLLLAPASRRDACRVKYGHASLHVSFARQTKTRSWRKRLGRGQPSGSCILGNLAGAWATSTYAGKGLSGRGFSLSLQKHCFDSSFSVGLRLS